ncbi:SDR family oxidoreductase [Sphingobacterium sp. Mn56C]|uniref:SDR family oxidoreductase n=1 Tax=Sphingobacterium sp. Mn56C TaxID=3395261 RepID=UPI003BED41A0
MRLKNKTALITGGTSGIGLATAKLFLAEGAKVIVAGQRDIKDSAAFDGYAKENLFFFQYDTAQVAAVERLAEFVKEKFQTLDIAFINAGVAKFAALEAVSEDLFDELIQVNFKGAFFTLQKLSPLFSEQASVILTSSSGIHKAHWGSSVYSASKAAIRSLAITLSAEWISRGIRVNVISPGSTDTVLLEKLGVTGQQLQEMKDSLINNIPTGRLIRPEEIANAVLYLAADGSESQTGTEIIVDGGAFLKV